MLVEENEFRQSLHIVIKGILAIFGLCLLRALASCFSGKTPVFGALTVPTIFCLAISLLIAGALIRLYRPVKTIATFYIEAMVRSGKLTGNDNHLEHLVAVAGSIASFVFLVVVYECLSPVIVAVNDSFIHLNAIVTILNVAVGVVAVIILIMAWRQAQPIFDDVTGHIADNVTRMSTGIAHKNCASCNAQNDKDAKFCVSCGKNMEPEKVLRTPPNKIRCAKCETVNMPYANFCHHCGNSLR